MRPSLKQCTFRVLERLPAKDDGTDDRSTELVERPLHGNSTPHARIDRPYM